MSQEEEEVLSPIIESTGMLDILGKASFIQGTLVTGDLTRLDGVIEGKVVGADPEKATIIVGPSGVIRGDITAGTVIVKGQVHGTIRAFETIRIRSMGRVHGTMNAKNIIVEKGAFVLADFLMQIPDSHPLNLSPV